jgi:hypothetical protein
VAERLPREPLKQGGEMLVVHSRTAIAVDLLNKLGFMAEFGTSTCLDRTAATRELRMRIGRGRLAAYGSPHPTRHGAAISGPIQRQLDGADSADVFSRRLICALAAVAPELVSEISEVR